MNTIPNSPPSGSSSDYPERTLAGGGDLTLKRERLAGWLADRLGGTARALLTELTPPDGNGASSETYLFDAEVTADGHVDHQSFVARFEPVGSGVYMEYDIPRQFELMRILSDRSNVSVPRVRWLETDRSVGGSQFYVMDRMSGRSPSDFPPVHAGGWYAECPSAQQQQLWLAGIDEMAKVHALDWKSLGLQFLSRPDLGAAGLDQQLAYLRKYFQWAAAGAQYPVIEAAFDWLDHHRPERSDVCLLWGDSRFGNTFFNDDGSITLLDWERADLGDPAADLAWWMCTDYTQSTGIGVPRLPGVPSYEDTVAHYEQSAQRGLDNLGYYLIFSTTNCAVTMIRICQLMADGGGGEAAMAMAQDNPVSRLLENLLEHKGSRRTPA